MTFQLFNLTQISLMKANLIRVIKFHVKSQRKSMNEFALLDEKEGIPLFYPFVAPETKEEVLDTLNSRWIGQGPKVNKFEKEFAKKLGSKNHFIATGSGTDSLHLAYILANIQPGDEVITPVFTCTATNLPILYEGSPSFH